MLQVKNFSYTYPGETEEAFRGISFSIKRGECVCLTGPSGCGKTTILLAIKKLLRGGNAKGGISVDVQKNGNGFDGNGVGLVFQNVESQILCTTVSEEIAFGPENLCIPPDEIGKHIESSLRRVGLDGFENRNVERLSLGQKQRLTIASVLAMEPHLLLLDEPTSQLDREGKEKLIEVLKRLKDKGYSLLIVEHDLESFKEIADRFLIMEKGKAIKETDQRPMSLSETSHDKRQSLKGLKNSFAIIADKICFSYPEIGEVLNGVDMKILQGELVHLYGPNGSGKSTLLRCLTGILTPFSGSLRIAGVNKPRPGSLLGKVGLLFQNPQQQIFENTVSEEVSFSLKRLEISGEKVKEFVNEALTFCEIAHLSERSPLTLSFGEQHRVTLASLMAVKPEVLLLDEPFSGLDLKQRYRLLDILSKFRLKYGTTVIIASHDPLPDRGWSDRVLNMENGKIELS